MADIHQPTPIRTLNAGDAAVKIVDSVTPAQGLSVDSGGRISNKNYDGSGNALTSTLLGAKQALDVNIAGGAAGTADKTVFTYGTSNDTVIGGVFQDTSPTVTAGQSGAVRMTANRGMHANLRDSSGNELLGSKTSPNSIPVVIASDQAAVQITNQLDSLPATQNVTAQDVASTTTAVFNQTWISGTPTAGSAASFALASYETGVLEVTGTWTGTLQVEISVDGGTNWLAHSIHLLGGPIFTSTFTGNVMGSINLAGKLNARVRATTAWTGTATVKLNLSQNPSSIYVANSLKLVDGSSATSTTAMNIVPASTAAIATNTAIVTALSPNTPLPTGANVIGAVTQSGTPWLVKDNADGPVTPGAVASNSMLVGAQFNTSLPTATTGQQVAIQTDANGRLLVGSIASALPAGANTVGKVAQDNTTQWVTSDLADGPVAPGVAATKSVMIGAVFNTSLPAPTNGQQVALQVDSSGRLLVGSIASALPAGTNALGSVSLNQGGSAVSATNPLPVVVSQTLPGTQVNKYNTTATLAVGAVANHVYTITTSKTFTGKKFWMSGSGKFRFDIQTSPDGSTYTTFWTGFNTESNLNVTVDLDMMSIQDSGTGSTIRINITNEDSSGSVYDVFSTISGVEN